MKGRDRVFVVLRMLVETHEVAPRDYTVGYNQSHCLLYLCAIVFLSLVHVKVTVNGTTTLIDGEVEEKATPIAEPRRIGSRKRYKSDCSEHPSVPPIGFFCAAGFSFHLLVILSHVFAFREKASILEF